MSWLRKIAEAEQALQVARDPASEGRRRTPGLPKTPSRAEGSDPGVTDTVVRQQLELRRSAADQAAREAQQRIDAALAAQKLIEAVGAAELDLRDQRAKAASGRSRSAAKATAAEKVTESGLQRCDLLERALDVHAADKQVADGQADVDKEAALQGRLGTTLGERAELAEQRAAITVPAHGALGPMRRLATRTCGSAGARLDVGFVVTVSPKGRLDLQVRAGWQKGGGENQPPNPGDRNVRRG